MNVTIENATLAGYKNFTKKEDLATYARVIIKTTEEGSPTLLRHFTNETYLKKVADMADNDTWKKLSIPLDEEIDVSFDSAKFSGILSEISVKRNLEKQKITYTFSIDKEAEASDVDKISIPYLNAR